MTSIFDLESLLQLAQQRKFDPIHVRRLHAACLKKGMTLDDALADIPDVIARQIRPELAPLSLRLETARHSQINRVAKLLLRTADDRPLESVLMRIQSGRVSLCVSSQSGCAVGCAFCATGQIRPVKSLTSDEILDQLLHANRYLATQWPDDPSDSSESESRAATSREGDAMEQNTPASTRGGSLRNRTPRVRNVVFMGMGEPLHNLEQVARAIETLVAPSGFYLSPRHVMISTVGVPDAMIEFARRLPEIQMAVSLHSADQQVREQLIPTAARYPLDELRRAIAEVTRIRRQPVMIEYLLLGGVNDSTTDADQLIDWLAGLDVHVNLIQYNPTGPDSATDETIATGSDESTSPGNANAPPFRRSTDIRVAQFSDHLKTSGLTVTHRYSQGADIDAACGQLAANRRK